MGKFLISISKFVFYLRDKTFLTSFDFDKKIHLLV